jgi:hypothetical protein
LLLQTEMDKINSGKLKLLIITTKEIELYKPNFRDEFKTPSKAY